MTLKASEAQIAYDWEFWIGRTVAEVTTWTQIYGFSSLPFPEQVPESVEVTHMQSPGRAREEIPGLLPVAEWSQEKQLWPGDDGDVLLEALAELTAAGTREDVLMEFHILDQQRRTYRGYINSFTPTGEVGGIGMAQVNVRIFDRVDNDRTLPAGP